jgi:hypothetical protein
VLDYNIDWTARLTSPDEIASSQWIVPDGLVGEDEDQEDAVTTIWLSSGTLNSKYEVMNRVVTAQGRTMDQTVTLRIKTR